MNLELPGYVTRMLTSYGKKIFKENNLAGVLLTMDEKTGELVPALLPAGSKILTPEEAKFFAELETAHFEKLAQ